MPIRDCLRLDHFYIGLSEADFKDFLPLTKIITGSRHQTVKSESDSWEGIYLLSQAGHYFEILKEYTTAGLALSPEHIQYDDASKIKDEMSWLSWRTGLRKFEDGQPWFEWQSTTPDNPSKYCLSTWTMKYFCSHRDHAHKPFATPTIRRFKKIHLLVGEQRFNAIRPSCEWAPGRNLFTNTRCILNIPTRDGTKFVMDFEKVPGDKVELKELNFEVRNDVFLEKQEMTNFTLSQVASIASLKRNRSAT